jgi:hypothetical protein
MAQPEKKVKDAIKKRMLAQHPGTWSYMPVQTGFGQHGIPDHIFCVPITITEEMVGAELGAFVAIEAKTETGKLSRFQTIQLQAIEAAGGIAEVVYGIGDSLERALTRIKEDIKG